MNETITRRRFMVGTAATGVGALMSACAPAVPEAQAPGGHAPPGGAPWQREWDELVAAARKEGTVVVLSLTGVGYREALNAFEEAFPGIHVEHQAFSSATTWVPKVQQERKAGVYTFDIGLVPTTSALINIRPAGG